MGECERCVISTWVHSTILHFVCLSYYHKKVKNESFTMTTKKSKRNLWVKFFLNPAPFPIFSTCAGLKNATVKQARPHSVGECHWEGLEHGTCGSLDTKREKWALMPLLGFPVDLFLRNVFWEAARRIFCVANMSFLSSSFIF